MSIFRRIFAMAFFCFLFSGLAGAETITLAADVWLPYNGDTTGASGYLIEIARAIFAKKGYSVEYEVIPWSRAKNIARVGDIDGIVGAYANDAPGFIFPQNELGLSVNKFFVRRGFDWRWESLESLQKINLGIIQDYDYGDEAFMYWLQETRNKSIITSAAGDEALPSLIKMLMGERIDVILEDQAVFYYNLTLLGIKEKVDEAGILGDANKVYIAFSPAKKTSSLYAKILSDGIAELRKSGELKAILAKYGLKDWAP